MAGEFVGVRFEVIFEEHTGGREQSRLPFRVLREGDADLRRDLQRRAATLQGLSGLGHSYFKYRAGCFFPKLSSRTFGGASSGDRQAAPGRLVVDTKRGLELGHAPASAADDVGLAIANETKKLRNVHRALSGSDSDKERRERVAACGLRAWKRLPPSEALHCWPTAVAFSLTLKQWGFVLVDGLEECERSVDAWDQLVLPARTKEMLLAMASSTQRGGGPPPRYRFRDVVDEKGGGCLFLLYGPPGTGKTLSARAVANRTDACFIRVIGSELVQKYVGEGARMVRELFQMARSKKACIVFFDEVDAIGGARFDDGAGGDNEVQRTMLEIVNQLDGFDVLNKVKIIMATNRPDVLDPALLRPGRLDRKVEISLPNEQGRLEVLKIHAAPITKHGDVDYEAVCKLADGFNAADLRNVCTEAGMFAIRAERDYVIEEDFMKAVRKMADSKKLEGTLEYKGV
uniref:AAA+ ATPase domain-containing protein n=1 Tax=Hemiselmis tepida TaxID=464990 RepID=A0A7S0VXY4_9CRYP